MTEQKRPDGFAALPKRFKDYVGALESQVRALTAQVPSRRSIQGARLKIVDRLYGGNDGFLPDDTEFEFTIDGVEFRVKAARGSGVNGIEISTICDGCVVYPRVSNVVVIGRARP